MPVVDIIDEIFIVADPQRVRSHVCDPARVAGWLPGVTLTAYDDRGPLGVRWTVAGALSGTAEVWLEEHGDGTVVHVYVRAEAAAPDPLRLGRTRRRMERRYVLPLKRALFAAKVLLEGGRQPGTTRVPLGERVVSASEGGHRSRRPRPQRPTGTSSEGASPDGRPDDLQHRDLR